MSAVAAVLAFGLLFAVFGLLLRGMQRAPRCEGCDGTCGTTCKRESGPRAGGPGPNDATGGAR